MDFRIDEFDVFEKGDFMETIRNVEINQLHDFKNYPFKVEVNMLNPVHVNINNVLSEPDMDIFKSKNQFFIDAATYYIEHFGREALTEPKEKKEPQFISTEELAVIEERIRQEAREESPQMLFRKQSP